MRYHCILLNKYQCDNRFYPMPHDCPPPAAQGKLTTRNGGLPRGQAGHRALLRRGRADGRAVLGDIWLPKVTLLISGIYALLFVISRIALRNVAIFAIKCQADAMGLPAHWSGFHSSGMVRRTCKPSSPTSSSIASHIFDDAAFLSRSGRHPSCPGASTHLGYGFETQSFAAYASSPCGQGYRM